MPGPNTCKAFHAALTSAVLPYGIIPLAAAKAVADKKFLACVNGARIVLAICDKPLGYKIKLL